MNTVLPGQIDVGGLLKSKNPRAAALLPRPIRRFLELVAHQRELRQFVAACTTGASEPASIVSEALRFLDVSVVVCGRERLPDSPHLVLCANHPTGGIDGLVLMQLLLQRYGGVRVPANDILTALPKISEFVVPVDKHGSNAGRIHLYEAAFQSEYPILVFPAGRTARPAGNRLREFPWNKAFLKQARRSGRMVVPVHLSGRNSRHFYLIWKLRRVLRIRPNLEMLLLVDELIRLRGTTVTVTVGTPRRVPHPARPKNDHAYAARLRREVERMGCDAELRERENDVLRRQSVAAAVAVPQTRRQTRKRRFG